MKKAKRVIHVQIDGHNAGMITVAWNATERQKVLAASKLPGVLARLKKEGVAAAEYTKTTYNILTQPPADFPSAESLTEEKLVARGLRSKKKVPFRGLGIPSAYGNRPIM